MNKIIQVKNREPFVCDMCKISCVKKFEWWTYGGKERLHICEKCAVREAGKKHLDRIKRLK